MKEIERVSLGGYAFTFEKEAAATAQQYLSELETHYRDREGGAEILEGIEERMAELLEEKCGRNGVVSKADIESVMSILGKPEDIDTEEGTEQKSQPRYEGAPRKRLYRDLSDKVVAGVCSGLGAYLKVDPALFRILFAVFTIVSICVTPHMLFFIPGISLPTIYIILWICMPPAKTVQQRWEQRGKGTTLNDIERKVESGAREFEDTVVRASQSGFFREFATIIGKIIGLFILLVGFAGLFAGSVAIFGSGRFGINAGDGIFGLGLLYDRGMHELYFHAPDVARALMQPGVNILLMMIAFIPFVGLLYGGLQMLFGFKSPKWHPGLVIFILWLLSIVALAVLIAIGLLTHEAVFTI